VGGGANAHDRVSHLITQQAGPLTMQHNGCMMQCSVRSGFLIIQPLVGLDVDAIIICRRIQGGL
jgi:hypothetical protein